MGGVGGELVMRKHDPPGRVIGGDWSCGSMTLRRDELPLVQFGGLSTGTEPEREKKLATLRLPAEKNPA